jgi:transcription antitermination factor NusG
MDCVLFKAEFPGRAGALMNSKVVFRPRGSQSEDTRPQLPQPFLWPAGIFSQDFKGPPAFWTCVRTRPRWEKKFAQWLIARQRCCFLPVFPHETVSGRKRRVSDLPLFPGFVFVEGDLSKKDFIQTGSVAYVLRPRSPHEAFQLHRELRNIWCGLTSGLYVTPVQNLAAGETCRIVQGPLQGIEAKFERMGRGGRLVLQVEMMGGGIAVEVPASGVEA